MFGTRGRRQGAAVLLSVVALAGCGDGETTSETSTTTTASTTEAAPSLSGQLTVMAPGPFKAFLEKAKAEFEADHPEVTINLNLGHVPTLLTQLEGGVVADVLITPDTGTMGQAKTKKLLSGDATVVAKSPMALVVPAANPAGVTDVSSLASEPLRVALCAAELPCGKLAQQLATKAGITLSADTLEPGGSPGIVTKASTDEIDVGLVFAADVAAGGAKVAKVAIPGDINVASDVSVARLAASVNESVATAFVEFVDSEAGLELLTASGFAAP